MAARVAGRRGAALCAVAAGDSPIAGSTAEYAWLEGVARGLMVGRTDRRRHLRAASGRHRAVRRPAASRSRRVAGSCTTLAEASDPTAYAIGRIVGWLIEPLLSLPRPRLPDRPAARRASTALLVGGALAAGDDALPPDGAARRALPRAVAVDHAATPAARTTRSWSPAREPAVIEDVVRPLREVPDDRAVRRRRRCGSRCGCRARATLMRRTLVPVLGVAIAPLRELRGADRARRIDPDRDGPDRRRCGRCRSASRCWRSRSWSASCAGGCSSRRRSQRLATRLAGHPRPDDLRDGARRRVRRPARCEIVYWRRRARRVGRRARRGGAPRRGRVGPLAHRDPRRRAGASPAIIHDEALRDEHGFVDAATSVRGDDARQPPPRRGGGRAARRGAGVARADPGDRGRRAPADRARPARRRAAAARGAADQARAGGRAHRRHRPPQRRAAPRSSATRSTTRSTRSARSRAASTRRRSPTAGSSRRCGRPRSRRRCPRPCSRRRRASATRARSRAPRTSAASRRCRTRSSTRAARAAVVIELADNGVLRFEVRDDGAGFDADAVEPRRRARRACATASPPSAASSPSSPRPVAARA